MLLHQRTAAPWSPTPRHAHGCTMKLGLDGALPTAAAGAGRHTCCLCAADRACSKVHTPVRCRRHEPQSCHNHRAGSPTQHHESPTACTRPVAPPSSQAAPTINSLHSTPCCWQAGAGGVKAGGNGNRQRAAARTGRRRIKHPVPVPTPPSPSACCRQGEAASMQLRPSRARACGRACQSVCVNGPQVGMAARRQRRAPQWTHCLAGGACCARRLASWVSSHPDDPPPRTSTQLYTSHEIVQATHHLATFSFRVQTQGEGNQRASVASNAARKTDSTACSGVLRCHSSTQRCLHTSCVCTSRRA
jgi:hypothetical protein